MSETPDEVEVPDPEPDQQDVERGAGFVADYPEQEEPHVDTAGPGGGDE